MSNIVAFYRNEAPDYLGRKLEDIWQWDHEDLEDYHNFIQVLFPNRQPSGVTPRAPVLDDATGAEFQGDETLRKNLARSLDVMLDFYGLRYVPDTGEVVRAAHFRQRAANWLNPYNHNYLRITRILHCLMDLGLPERARAFFSCLKQIYEEYSEDIGQGTFAYWQEAVTRNE